MSESNKPAPTQEEMDDLMGPDNLSGAQREILKKMDEKNVDRADLAMFFSEFLDAYNNAKKTD